MPHAMTLRLPDDLYERLRTQAFKERKSLTALVVAAIEKATPGTGLGCDSCGEPYVYVTTPGGFRFCEKHMPGRRSDYQANLINDLVPTSADSGAS